MGFFANVALGSALGGLAKDMKENREYARDKAERVQDYLYQRGLERRQEVNKTRNALQNSVDYLQSKGLDSRSLNAMLIENPKEVIRLAAAAEEAETDGRLTKSILNQAVEVASDFDDQGMTPSELIKKATPDFVTGADLKKPEEVELNALQKLFGRTSSQDILYDVYSQSLFGDEATGADVAASISAPTIKGRKEGPSNITVDLGALAEDDTYDSTYKRDARNAIYGKYDLWADGKKTELSKALDPDSEDYVTDEAERETVLEYYNNLIEILSIEDNDFLKYQKLMELNSEIAKNLYEQSPGFAAVLSDPDYFLDGTVDLITTE